MAHVTLGRVWGIPIRLHWSFLLVLPLFAYLMGQAYFGTEGMVTTVDFAWGGALAVALFASVVLHELGHSYAARRYGVPIESITLLPIGGVAQLERMPEEPIQEFWVALAGPIVSFGLAIPFLAVDYVGLAPATPAQLPQLVFLVGYLNGFLGAFNLLIPAFPMDGGRVLRAGLAHRLGQRRATEVAGAIGKTLALAMGILGVVNLGGGGWLLLLIAFFIYVGAQSEVQQVRATVALGEITIGEVMTRDVRAVDPHDTVDEVYQAMRETRHLAFPVVEDGRVVGVVGLQDLGSVDPEERWDTDVRSIMRPDPPRASPDERVRDLLPRLTGNGEGRLVVVTQGRDFLGVVSRTDVVRLIQILDAEGASGPPTWPEPSVSGARQPEP
jgi:Zn-dependent protease/predicted transcriptional regulator